MLNSLITLTQYQGSLEEERPTHQYPLGHPRNKIGCKRAKKLQMLDRQVAETKAEMKKIEEFQSRIISDSITAAKAAVAQMMFGIRQQLQQSFQQSHPHQQQQILDAYHNLDPALGPNDLSEEQSSREAEQQNDVVVLGYTPPAPIVPFCQFNISG